MKKHEIDTRVRAELMADGRIEITNTTYSSGRIVRVQRAKFQVTAIAPLLERLGWKKPGPTYRELEAEMAQSLQPRYTTGHCENRNMVGGCPLHNLHCMYPECDRKEIAPEGRTEVRP